MENLSSLMEFMKLTHLLQQVQRAGHAVGEDRKENDAEHSYQLAMVGWFIAESQNLDLDKDKILKYALSHDLVEAYAGDTHAWSPDIAGKNAREREAALELKRNFPKFESVHKLIADYEKREDSESKFVYALDKILPMMNAYLEDGRSFRTNGITLEWIIQDKTKKVSLSPEIQEYFDQMISLLRANEAHLFTPRTPEE